MPSPVVLGIDFGGTKIALAVGDLDGNRLGAVTIPAAAESGAAFAARSAISSARESLSSPYSVARLLRVSGSLGFFCSNA